MKNRALLITANAARCALGCGLFATGLLAASACTSILGNFELAGAGGGGGQATGSGDEAGSTAGPTSATGSSSSGCSATPVNELCIGHACSEKLQNNCGEEVSCGPCPVWSLPGTGSFGTTGIGTYGLAVDQEGAVVISGECGMTIDLGEGPQLCASGATPGIFLAKYDAAAKLLWSKTVGTKGSDKVGAALATDSENNIFLSGWFTGDVTFVGCPALPSATIVDGFVAKFDPSGQCLWAKSIPGSAHARSVAVDVAVAGNANDDRVVVVGDFTGSLNFCNKTVSSVGGTDMFVAKFNQSGFCEWSQTFGGSGNDVATGVSVFENQVFLTGTIGDTTSIQSSVCKPISSNGGGDVLLASLQTLAGDCRWSKSFGDAGVQQGNSVAVNQSGIFLTGAFAGALDFGNGALLSADLRPGTHNAFVAKLDVAGKPQWSRGFGDANDQQGTSITADSEGNARVTGLYQGKIDLGGGPLENLNPPNADPNNGIVKYGMFVAKLSPSGEHVWSKGFAQKGSDQRPFTISSDAAGETLVAGNASGVLDFGQGALPTLNGSGFVVKFAL